MYLSDIVEHKRKEIAGMKPADRERGRAVIDPVESLRRLPFIAEIKKASPSRGDINVTVDITAQASAYERGGAGAISVLTDSRYFKGDFSFLTEVSRAVDLPMLCKDFILGEVQVENAYLHGADFILLIAAILSEDELKSLSRYAARHSLKVLYELHNIDEFDKIRKLDLEMVGVNSRDLKTFKIDKTRARNVISSLKGGFLKVAESGIETAGDIRDFSAGGANVYLIGSALMTAPDPAALLRSFRAALEEPCS